MTARCMSEPVSWLRLERYHLGEVDDAERVLITTHLAACAACAATLATIERDDALVLPPFPAHRQRRGGGWRARFGVMITGGLALAAALVLSVVGEWRRGGNVDPSMATRMKGDAVAFSLVRDDDEKIEEAGGIFRQGDRFKVVVTCPPSMDATFDLVVYDAAGTSFPLAPARVACGNGVPLPGAFRLTGSSEEKVCLVWAIGSDVERETVKAEAPAGRSLCKSLMLASPP